MTGSGPQPTNREYEVRINRHSVDEVQIIVLRPGDRYCAHEFDGGRCIHCSLVVDVRPRRSPDAGS